MSDNLLKIKYDGHVRVMNCRRTGKCLKTKNEFKFEFSRRIIESYGRTVEEAHITEKFMVLETMVRDYASVNWAASKAIVQNNEQKTNAIISQWNF